MIRFSYAVMSLLIAMSITGCKTDRDLQIEKTRAYISANPSLDQKTAATIAANRLHKGMTMEQVRAAWGDPVIVQHFSNNSQYWLFDCFWPHFCNGLSRDDPPEAQYESRASFENGKLVDWHN